MKEQIKNTAVEEIEGVMTELIPVEAEREQLEGEVEKVRAKKLRSLAPQLKPIDKSERNLKRKGISILMANRKTKGFFEKGKKSRRLRSGTVGIKKGPAHVKLLRGITWEMVLDRLEEIDERRIKNDRPGYEIIEITKRVHRTKLRQAIRADEWLLHQLRDLLKIVQREHGYMKTKVSKRTRPTSAKGKTKKTAVK